MTVHFMHEVERLKKRMLSLSAVVEEAVRSAVKSVVDYDAAAAEKVIREDIEIDRREVEIEEECLKVLALHQPVAIDLRFIVAVLKINNDLERIGDLAVNVAERGVFLAEHRTDPPFDLPAMFQKVQFMLKSSLDALVNMDADQARRVCASDDEVDAMNRNAYQVIKRRLRERVEDLESLIHLLSVSRHLERIADLATNIAEDVIYMAEGQIVRHKTEDYLGRDKAAQKRTEGLQQ